MFRSVRLRIRLTRDDVHPPCLSRDESGGRNGCETYLKEIMAAWDEKSKSYEYLV